MINIDPALKTIYKNDRFPMSTVAHPKDMEANFAAFGLVIAGDQFADDKGEFELSEGICRDSDLKFGKCNSAQVKFTVADVTDEIAGKEFYLKQTVDNIYEMPYGYFTVDNCPKQDDLRFKDITAYDRMRKAFIDVAAWYNGLTFPMTLADFRASFLSFVGLTQDTSKLPLPNDSMTVEKTVEAAQLPGQQVIEAIEEINGVFGVINSEGKFSHTILKPVYGLYPSNTLYPLDTLFPVAETDTSYTQPDLLDETVTVAMREGIRFEEYTVPEIDKLIIRGEEDDIGAIVGTGTNAYIIEGNFLVFGKTAAELEIIARNAFGYMAKRPYRPFESSQLGLPYIKPGDMLKFEQDDPVVGYVLNRTLKGVQTIRDEYASPGSQKRMQITGQNTEIIKLKYKTTKIKKDVEGVRIDVEDLVEQTSTQFEQTANSIALKVSKDSVIQAINLSTEGLKINVTKLDITGLVTITSLGTPGSVVIDGGNLKAGTVVADTVRADWVYTGNLSADQITVGTISGNRINGGTIQGVQIIASGSLGVIEIDGPYIQGWNSSGALKLEIDAAGNITCGNITCSTLNGYGPVHNGNIGSKSVAYATDAGSAFDSDISYSLYNTGLSKRVYVSVDDNFRPGSSLQGSCGSSAALWTAVYAQNGTIQTSDRRKKTEINPFTEKYLLFAQKLLTLPRTFKMIDGQSGRIHVGFIAQDIENAMTECGITDMEFAGLIKSPIYTRKLIDEEGNEIDEYDTTSDIVDYSYGLRYDEFIPMLFALYADLINI